VIEPVIPGFEAGNFRFHLYRIASAGGVQKPCTVKPAAIAT
jgi:hypothetical protein